MLKLSAGDSDAAAGTTCLSSHLHARQFTPMDGLMCPCLMLSQLSAQHSVLWWPAGALAAAAEALVAQSNATAHAKKGQGMRQRPDALFRTCAELISVQMTLFWRAERPGDRTSKGEAAYALS